LNLAVANLIFLHYLPCAKDDADKFRQQAEHCRQQAEKAISPLDRGVAANGWGMDHAGDVSRGTPTVKDYQASIEKLRKEAAEAALIRDLATNSTKREMFDRLHQHLTLLADEVERAMKSDKPE
jgi:hypothetical protein